VSMTVSVLPGV